MNKENKKKGNFFHNIIVVWRANISIFFINNNFTASLTIKGCEIVTTM